MTLNNINNIYVGTKLWKRFKSDYKGYEPYQKLPKDAQALVDNQEWCFQKNTCKYQQEIMINILIGILEKSRSGGEPHKITTSIKHDSPKGHFHFKTYLPLYSVLDTTNMDKGIENIVTLCDYEKRLYKEYLEMNVGQPTYIGTLLKNYILEKAVDHKIIEFLKDFKSRHAVFGSFVRYHNCILITAGNKFGDLNKVKELKERITNYLTEDLGYPESDLVRSSYVEENNNIFFMGYSFQKKKANDPLLLQTVPFNYVFKCLTGEGFYEKKISDSDKQISVPVPCLKILHLEVHEIIEHYNFRIEEMLYWYRFCNNQRWLRQYTVPQLIESCEKTLRLKLDKVNANDYFLDTSVIRVPSIANLEERDSELKKIHFRPIYIYGPLS